MVFADGFSVFIDVGHGGRDPGAIGLSGYKEKDMCLLFAQDLQVALGRYPQVSVLLSRNTDKHVSLKKRLVMANTQPIDVFVSVHMDKGNKPKYRGMSAYVQSLKSAKNTTDFLQTVPAMMDVKKSKYAGALMAMLTQASHDDSYKLAQSVLSMLRKQGVTLHASKPIRRELFLFHQHVPNFLLELGYISNQADLAVILDPKQRADVASAVAAGIYGFMQ